MWRFLAIATLFGLIVLAASYTIDRRDSDYSGFADQAPPPGFDKPNIIIVYTDDQRWDTLDYMPAVSRMANEGVLFTNSFVTTPVCGPSRASLLTGRLASTQGITQNEKATTQFDPTDTIAVKLQEQGYATALFGKYMNGYRDQFPEVPPGWSEWRVLSDRFRDLLKRRSLYFNPVMSWNGQSRRVFGYSTDLIADYASEFIEQNADRPFFMLLSFWAPHVPLSHAAERHKGLMKGQVPAKPPSFEEEHMSDKPAWIREAAVGRDLDPIWDHAWPQYLELLLSVDDAVAGIRSKLEELGLDQNTIIIFTSDNGFLMGEHWHVGKGVPYEESIRVPLVVWNPLIGHRQVDEMVLNIDIAPTLADLAGTEIDSDGQSFLPLLFGFKTPWRRLFEIECHEFPYRAFRSRLFKFIKWDSGHRELYILPLDPFEIHGLHWGTSKEV